MGSCRIWAPSGLEARAGSPREPLLLPGGVDRAGQRGPPGPQRSREAQPAAKAPTLARALLLVQIHGI